MPVKFAYLYCLTNTVIGDLLKIGVINVAVSDRRRLGDILSEAMGDTWQFVMAKFIHHPQNLDETLQKILKTHYPVVERNIYNMSLDDATLYFDLVRGESVHVAHVKRQGY